LRRRVRGAQGIERFMGELGFLPRARRAVGLCVARRSPSRRTKGVLGWVRASRLDLPRALADAAGRGQVDHVQGAGFPPLEIAGAGRRERRSHRHYQRIGQFRSANPDGRIHREQ